MPTFLNQERVDRPRTPRRQSAIPRPTKQLVLNSKNSAVGHASKPSLNTIPITPSRKQPILIPSNYNKNNESKRTQPFVAGSYAASNKENLSEQENEVAVLELIPFGKQPIVNFGQVLVNEKQTKYITLRNLLDSQQQLYVRSLPKQDKGFTIEDTEFLIASKSEIIVAITWAPKTVGNHRETITFQDNNRLPKRIVLLGRANNIKPHSIPQPRVVSKLARPTPKNLLISKSSPSRFGRHKMTLTKGTANQPLNRLIYASRRRDSSQIVKKILSQCDNQVATRIQSYWRLILERRHLEKLKRERQGLILVQSYCRLVLARRQLRFVKAIIMVQSLIRGTLYRQHLMKSREHDNQVATRIQSYWRLILERRHLEKLKRERQGLILVQSYCRLVLARRQLRFVKAIVMVQSLIRGTLYRQHLLKSREHDNQVATQIQSYWRLILGRRHLEKLKRERQGLILVQSYCRLVLARRQLRFVKAIVMVQSLIRGTLYRQHLMKSREHDNQVATQIQSYWRLILGRRHLEKLKRERQGLILVQSYCRLVLARRQLRFVKAIIMVQSMIRGTLYRQHLLKSREHDNQVATQIQSYWRLILGRRHLEKLKRGRQGLILVQSYCRLVLARRQLRFVKAIIMVQAVTRGALYRKHLMKSIEAMLRCQRNATKNDLFFQ